MKHLKSQQEYIDDYDKLTVWRCRQLEEIHNNSKTDPIIEIEGKKVNSQPLFDMIHKMQMRHMAGELYLKKDEKIREWQERDRARDELFESAKEPENISCITCNRLMFMSSKHFDLGFDDKPDRVMFFFDCPLGHIPRRVFYNTGEERRIKPVCCSKCDSLATEDHQKTDLGISIKRSCTQCPHVDIEELDFSSPKEEADPNFSADRERFCLTREEGLKYMDEKHHLEGIGRLVDSWKEKDTKKELYEKVAQIKKLTIVQLEELLSPLLEANKYIKFHMKDPEDTRDPAGAFLFVPFIAYDASGARTEQVSIHEAQKLIKDALANTNWRLMSDGIRYRLGMIEGRLRAYEGEERLLKLVE